MILISIVSLIAISLVVWVIHKPKLHPESGPWEYFIPKLHPERPPWEDYIPDTEVEIKGVGLIYFPGDMSAEQIRDVMRRIIGSGFTPLTTATNQWRYSPATGGP
jgi:hypothetical protein